MKLIPHSRPWLIDDDLIALERVLASQMLAQGEITRQFEDLMSQWFSLDCSGVAVGSGSAAIVLALLALGVNKEDEVILPSYVCKSVFEAILTTGATPILCDVSPNWTVTPENMINHISPRTKALIVPHLYGIFAEVQPFRKFGIPIIEDCAQAIDYQQKRCIIGDIAIFSFHPTKCLTTGEGGMAVSPNPELVRQMYSIRDGTISINSGRLFSPLSDISSSLGLSQLSRYKQSLDIRFDLGEKYRKELARVIPENIADGVLKNSTYFRFPLKIEGGLDKYKEQFIEKKICIRKGVDKLIHRLVGLPDNNFPVSVSLFDSTVSLPIYPSMNRSEHTYCIESAIEIFSK